MNDASAYRSAGASAPNLARIAGALYVLTIIGAVIGPFGMAPSGLTAGASSAPSLTAILHSQFRYALGGSILIAVYACDAAMAFLFHRLLKPVDGLISFLSLLFRLAFAAIAGGNVALNHFAPLLLVGGWMNSGALSSDQLHALALRFLSFRTFGFDAALVFFGIHLLLLGYLVFRSRFFPRILGAGLVIGGVGYVANILVAALPHDAIVKLFPYVLLPAGVAEVSFALWLLIMGVNQQRWNERAGLG